MYLKSNTFKIMGILNVTPDSFSDGGKFSNLDSAMFRCEEMIDNGADIVDVGGESSRPGSEGVSLNEEIDRVIPVIKKIKTEFDITISVDTTKSKLAKLAISECGADIINDISALNSDKDMAYIAAQLNVPIIMMHMKGIPKNMQDNPYYDNVVDEISKFFDNRIQYAIDKGIKRENLILDPGIGFGKRLEDNINIIKHLKKFKVFSLPILIGLSRKKFLGEITGEREPSNREIESVMANIISIKNGASIIRTHNVKAINKAVKIHTILE